VSCVIKIINAAEYQLQQLATVYMSTCSGLMW